MHVLGADLHFKGVAVFGDHRGMQRLIEVRPRHRDEIFDSPWNRSPLVVDDAENGITVIDAGGDDADGIEIVGLVDGNTLSLELLPDAEEALDAAFDARRRCRLLSASRGYL